MTTCRRRKLAALLAACCWLNVDLSAASTPGTTAPLYLQQIGWTELQSQLGAQMPTGAGLVLAQVEHPEQGDGGYAPDATNPQFAGKTFALKSGPSTVSGHATRVGANIYGLSDGVAPGIKHINPWENTSWAQSILRAGTTRAPAVEPAQIENHSWKGSLGSASANLDALRRFDYMIDRDKVTAVVAVGNEDSSTIPNLLASNYNAITVGISAGTTNGGLTTFDGPGRVKPDLVAPQKSSSLATALVSGSAALLLQSADTESRLAGAQNPQVIKALLLAGATQSQFPEWHHTATVPLDTKFGAGQLNIDDSYIALVAGEQGPGSNIAADGWDFHDTAPKAGGTVTYTMTVTSQDPELEIALTWDRTITSGLTNGQFGNLQSSLANLDLDLYQVNGQKLTLVDHSISTVDNVEFLVEHNLAPGTYRISVVSDTPGVGFGLAWYTTPPAGTAPPSLAAAAVPEPAGIALGASAALYAGVHLAARALRNRR